MVVRGALTREKNNTLLLIWGSPTKDRENGRVYEA